jgi:hypothetical protein
MDAELEAEQRVTKDLLKEAAQNIISLDMGRASFSIAYSEPRSFLQRLSDLFSPLVTCYLDHVSGESDPELRLQLFMIGGIASFASKKS